MEDKLVTKMMERFALLQTVCDLWDKGDTLGILQLCWDHPTHQTALLSFIKRKLMV